MAADAEESSGPAAASRGGSGGGGAEEEAVVVRTNDDLQMGVVKPTGPSRPSLWTRALSEIAVSVLLGLAPLYIGFAVSQFVSAYAIPSRSMDETLKVGDVVLAEKASSRLGLPLQHGDLVFFAPPAELEDVVGSKGLKSRIGSRDLFVKRVAAVGGDTVQLDASGRGVLVNGVTRAPPPLACADERGEPAGAGAQTEQQSVEQSVQSMEEAGRISNGEARALLREVSQPEQTEDAAAAVVRRAQSRVFGNVEARAVDPSQLGATKTIPPRAIFVLGDCEARSTDSRVWGPIEESRVVARPFVRIWPPERVGAVDDSTDLNPFRREALKFRMAVDEALRRGRDADGLL